MASTTTTRRYVQLRGLAQTANLRTAVYMGDNHIIVPVVALVGNSVVWPMGADGPEFVPAEELALCPDAWNGRPCVPDHPENGTSSANIPHILESMSFGQLFNTKFESGSLKTEAWLSIARAEELGGDPQRVIERCLAGEMVEVSVGAWITVELRKGEYEGKSYISVWTDILPDHLALLPEGVEGACSIEMGCGAPRAAKKETKSTMSKALKTSTNRDRKQGGNSVEVNSVEVEESSLNLSPTTMPKPSTLSSNDLPSRLLMESLNRTSRFTSSVEDGEGTSDVDLRDALWSALRATVPGFDWIVEVFPDSSTVIYTAMPEREYIYYRQTFVLGADGTVTLNDDQEVVEPVTRYEAAQDDSNNSNNRAACSCQKSKAKGKGAKMSSKKIAELVGKLIACKHSPFKEADRKMLEASTEDRLAELEEEFRNSGEEEDDEETTAATPANTPPTPPTPSTPSSTESVAAAPLTEEQYLAQAPESIRSMFAKYKAQDQARRTALISTLKSSQQVYNEKRLAAMSTDQLEEVAALTKSAIPDTSSTPVSYAGRGMAVPPNTPAVTEPPDPYDLAGLAASRKSRSAKTAVAN